jgi:2-oxoglutarate ferredoxin oxidoreductase subunit gamma
MDAFEIRFSGTGGQGLQLSAKILAMALNREGKHVARSQSYEPTSRGGTSRSDLVVSDATVDYPLATALDYLIVLDQSAVEVSRAMLRDGSTIIVDSRHVSEPPKGNFIIHSLPLSETAIRLGNERVANIVCLGALIGLGGICTFETLVETVRAGVPKKLLDLNLEAVAEGHGMTAPEAGTAVATAKAGE